MPSIAHHLRRAAALAALGVLGLTGGPATAQQMACGDLKAGYGPFDYRRHRGETLDIVERVHFTGRIEALSLGTSATRDSLGSDIAYTLRSFPNHHRALIAMTKWGDRHRTQQPPGSEYTVQCWYERAARFAPDDTVVRALYAQFLAKNNARDQALQQLAVAREHAKDNPFSHYNLGLVYFELKEFDLALKQAHAARKLGFPREELAEMLKRENRWQEPSD